MKVWVDSSDALFRAVKALGLKKVDDQQLADAYVTSGGEKVTFLLGSPVRGVMDDGDIVWSEAEQKQKEIYDRDVKPRMVPQPPGPIDPDK